MLFLLALFLPGITACGLPFSSSTTTSSQIATQQPPAARQLYVAIGASDTFGQGSDDPRTQSWPADLDRLLGQNTRLINLGIPGIDTHDAVNIELPVALDAHPKLVTIWLAVNDIVDQVPATSYEQDLDHLLSSLRSKLPPQTRIAIANVPDLSYLPRFQGVNHQQLEAQIAAYNTIIARLAVRYRALLVDLYQQATALARHPEYISDDGFHPNALGYTLIAQVFYQALQKSST